MQIQNIQSPNFGARIIKTQYLKAGTDYAKGSKINLEEKNSFYNALKFIKDDSNMYVFEIRKLPLIRKYVIKVNGKDYTEKFQKPETTDGEQCIKAIQHFISDYYGKRLAVQVRTAKTTGVEMYERAIRQVADIKETAKSELNLMIDNILE